MQLGKNTNDVIYSLDNFTTTFTKSKPKGRVKKSDIIHYIEFEEASCVITDEFWASTLLNCAKKKMPKNFVYTINCNEKYLTYKPSKISILLPDLPASFAKTAICFFQEHGKLYSKLDQDVSKKNKEKLIIKDIMDKSLEWGTIHKAKNKRTIYIHNYVETKYANLDYSIRKEVFSKINRGFEYKYMNKDHVKFENGEIKNIDGVDADINGAFYTRPFPTINLPLIDREIDTVKAKEYKHYANWCKYVDDLSKYLITSAKGSATIQMATQEDDT